MGKIHKIFCAGFGGQGVMSMGQLLAYGGLLEGKEVSWCPSYGPEMRGGEANCSVVVSDEPIGSPLINGDATVAAFMNVAAFRKFISQVAPGGTVYINSSLVSEKVQRDDVKAYYLPVNEIAAELGNIRLANIVMLGAMNEIEHIVSQDQIVEAFRKVFGASKEKFISANREALLKGAEEVKKTLA